MAIVIRGDVEMSLGKTISQACHACLESSEESKKKDKHGWKAWRDEGSGKIVLEARNFDEFKNLEARTVMLGLPHARIQDRGLTEVKPGTITALGIGPAAAKLVDKVIGSLPLLK
jgi:PTH2 family peptidyl-tRNA hydrolase